MYLAGMSGTLTLSLGKTAEYALRAMCHLALADADEPLQARALAEASAVPLPYLSKVMRQLAEAGLVTSAKGHGGGFRLARTAKRITYRDVLAAVGYGTGAKSCVFGWGRCRDEHPCPMHHSWVSLGRYFAAWAGETTLASLAAQAPAPRMRPTGRRQIRREGKAKGPGKG